MKEVIEFFGEIEKVASFWSYDSAEEHPKLKEQIGRESKDAERFGTEASRRRSAIKDEQERLKKIKSAPPVLEKVERPNLRSRADRINAKRKMIKQIYNEELAPHVAEHDAKLKNLYKTDSERNKLYNQLGEHSTKLKHHEDAMKASNNPITRKYHEEMHKHYKAKHDALAPEYKKQYDIAMKARNDFYDLDNKLSKPADKRYKLKKEVESDIQNLRSKVRTEGDILKTRREMAKQQHDFDLSEHKRNIEDAQKSIRNEGKLYSTAHQARQENLKTIRGIKDSFKTMGTWGKLKPHSKAGIIAGGAGALGGLGYAGYRMMSKDNPPKQPEQQEQPLKKTALLAQMATSYISSKKKNNMNPANPYEKVAVDTAFDRSGKEEAAINEERQKYDWSREVEKERERGGHLQGNIAGSPAGGVV